MNVGEVHKAVTRQFGDETGGMIDINDTIRWINEGQFQIARRISDVLATAPINVAVGDYKYPLPADFFRSKIIELDGRRLQLVDKAQLGVLFPDLDSTGAQQSVPKFCSVSSIGTNLYELTLAPIPGATGVVTVIYQGRPPLINSTEDALYLPEEYHTTLVTYCLSKAKELDGDIEGSTALSARFKTEVAEDSHDSTVKDDETYPFIRASSGDVTGGSVWSGDVW